MNRRTFIVRFSMAGLFAPYVVFQTNAPAPRLDGAGSNELDAWIAINTQGTVTAYTGKCELGQGLYTAQVQLIAEELSVPVSRVNLVQCDTALTPDQGTTSGAQSHPTNFNQGALALAGAAAREALLSAAAKQFGANVDQLALKDGTISLKSDSSKKVTYGQLIGGRKFGLPLNRAAKRKPASEWTVLGTSVARVDIPEIVSGWHEYVHNVKVAGMLHGRVVRPPSVGATLVRVDESSVQGMPGFVKVVIRKNWLGVVAQRPWQAMQIANQLKVEWTRGIGLPAHDTFYETMRNSKETRDTYAVNSKTFEPGIAGAAKVLKATYRYPYQMHGSIGSSCAVADVRVDQATIWSATQAVYPLKASMAMVLGIPADKVHIIYRQGSGCYGVNQADSVSYDAAILSQAAGKPVRVQLARKDEMAWENYGYPFIMDEGAGVKADGSIAAWEHETWSAVMGGRPGNNAPGNVAAGFLAGFAPQAFAPRSPAPEPSGYANGSNAVPSYYSGGTGSVDAVRVLTHNVRSPFFTGPLRSPERLQNTFAHECFMDEIAASVKADPVDYRVRHLRDPRLIEVLQRVAKAAGWDTRPSPRIASRPTGVVSGRGVSCVLYEGDNSYCALVAEVQVDTESGAIHVQRIVVGIDAGPISNPDGLKNQLEGGALHGLSRTLLEEVTWDDQKVTSIDWKTYHPLAVGAEIPKIDTVLINRPNQRATGAGEAAVTLVAAAIGNAVFDATGVRLRQVPFTPERVKTALQGL